jgi:hypothetical protein
VKIVGDNLVRITCVKGGGYNNCVMAYTIGTLNEQPLHAGLKAYYAKGGGRLEENVSGYYIDVVNDDKLIEIQTKNFMV